MGVEPTAARCAALSASAAGFEDRPDLAPYPGFRNATRAVLGKGTPETSAEARQLASPHRRERVIDPIEHPLGYSGRIAPTQRRARISPTGA